MAKRLELSLVVRNFGAPFSFRCGKKKNGGRFLAYRLLEFAARVFFAAWQPHFVHAERGNLHLGKMRYFLLIFGITETCQFSM